LIAGLLAVKVKWVAGRVEAVVGRVIVGSLRVRQTVRVLGPPNIIFSTVATVVAKSSSVARSIAPTYTADRGIASAGRAETATKAASSSISLKGNQEEGDQINNFHLLF